MLKIVKLYFVLLLSPFTFACRSPLPVLGVESVAEDAPTPTPTPSPAPSPTPSPTPSATPPAGTYPGYTYNVPLARPRISLADYDAASLSGSAYLRLRNAVDDVVNITNGMSSTATYSQLVTALNSGHWGYSVVDSIVMYRRSGDAKYLEQAVRMMDMLVTSETLKINSNTNPTIAGNSYLDVGPLMEQLALTYDYGYALLSTTQRSAWTAYAEQAIFNVWNYSQAKWAGRSAPWSGWSVNDPGNNYHYSFLKATQLWALASYGQATLFTYQGQSMNLFQFLQGYKFGPLVSYYNVLAGGGSREGTGYGTAHKNLFELFRYWKSSTGEDLSALTSHTRDTIDYWLHATVPTLKYYAHIGDQARDAQVRMFDYQRQLMQEAMALNVGTAQAGRAAWWLLNAPVTNGGSAWVYGQMRFNYNYRYDLLASSVTPQAPSALVYHATGVGALFGRSSWVTDASWFSTVAGPFDQSHAHQEQGGFSFFRNSWLSVTSNMWSQSGIHQEVATNNIIRFIAGGVPVAQNLGVSSMTYTDSADVLQVSQNLTNAYSSHSSQVSMWRRNLSYTRSSHTLQVVDTCTVGTGVTPVFQVHVPTQPTHSGAVATAGSLRVTVVSPAGATLNAVSMSSEDSSINSGYRIDVTPPVGAPCGFTVNLQAI